MISFVIFLLVILTISIFPFTRETDPTKSYLINDHNSLFNEFEVDQEWLYIPSSNDIVQRSIETGQVVRTLRGHSVDVQDLFILNDTSLVSGSADGIVLQWDLVTGAILKRIESKCQLQKIAYFQGSLLVSCIDITNSWIIDFETGKAIDSFGFRQQFYACNDVFYGYYNSDGLYMYRKNLTRTLIYPIVVSTLIRVEETIYLAEKHTLKIALITSKDYTSNYFVGTGHTVEINSLCIMGDTLISGSNDFLLITWNVSTRSQIETINYNYGQVYMIKPYNASSILIAFQSETIALVETESFFIKKNFTEKQIYLMSLALYGDFLLSGSVVVPTKEWSLSEKNLVQTFSNISYSNALIVISDFLLSCYNSIQATDLLTNEIVKEFAFGEVLCRYIFLYDKGFVYTPSANDYMIYKYNLTSTELLLQFQDGSVYSVVNSMVIYISYLFVTYLSIPPVQWSIDTGLVKSRQPSGSNIGGYFFVADLRVIFTIGPFVENINPLTFVKSLIVRLSNDIFTLVYDKSSGLIFASGDPPTIFAYDQNFIVVYQLDGHSDVVNSILVNGDFLFSCSSDGTVKQFSLSSRRLIYSFEDRGQCVTSMLRFNNTLIYGNAAGILNCFDVDTAFFVRSYSLFSAKITDILSVGTVLFLSSEEGTIMTFNTCTMTQRSLIKSSSSINALAFLNNYLFSGSSDKSITQLNSTTGHIVKIFLGHNAFINDIIVKGIHLYSAGSDYLINRWNIDNAVIELSYKGHSNEVTSILLLNKNLFSASLDKSMIMWDTDKAIIIRTFKRTPYILGHLGPINKIVACNSYIFSASSDWSIKQWEPNGNVIDTLFGHQKPVNCLYCNGNSLFSGSDDFAVFLWYPTFFNTVMTTSTITFFDTFTKNNQLADIITKDNTIIIIPIVGALIVLLFIILYLLLRKKSTKSPESFKNADRTSNTSSTLVSSGYQNSSTLFTQTLGLSIPGYLEISISSFRLLNQVAKGGGGTIYLAEIFDKQDKVIAKVFDSKYESLSFMKKLAFDQEVTLMEYLKQSRNIVKIFGFCREPCCILMKYYKNGSLNDLIHSKSVISTFKCVKYLTDIAKGIQYMHIKQIIHGDLKPDNVLVDSDEYGLFMVLTDFGIAQITTDEHLASKKFQIVNLKGLSVHYAAPEVFLRFRDKSKKSYSSDLLMSGDVYAFSLIVYELLTRSYPWSQ